MMALKCCGQSLAAVQVCACGAAVELWGVCVPDKPAGPVWWTCCARVCRVAGLGGLLQCLS